MITVGCYDYCPFSLYLSCCCNFSLFFMRSCFLERGSAGLFELFSSCPCSTLMLIEDSWAGGGATKGRGWYRVEEERTWLYLWVCSWAANSSEVLLSASKGIIWFYGASIEKLLRGLWRSDWRYLECIKEKGSLKLFPCSSSF